MVLVVVPVLKYLYDCYRGESDKYTTGCKVKPEPVVTEDVRPIRASSPSPSENFEKILKECSSSELIADVSETLRSDELSQEIKLGRKIDEGGFGRVHIATLWGRNVAVKKVDLVDRHRHLTVLKEVILLRQCHSHFVLKYIGLFYENPGSRKNRRACIVTEFLEGRCLDDFYSKHIKEVSWDVTKYVAGCVLYAIQFIHSQKVAHLDIKMENIALTGDGVPKLIDFGSARYNTATLENRLCGTIGYTSPPEMLNGQTFSTFQSDLWAFGITLYMMLSGRNPFAIASAYDSDGRLKGKLKESYVVFLHNHCEDTMGNALFTTSFPMPTKAVMRDFRDFMRSLFKFDPSERLGAVGGVGELMQHRLFYDTDYEGLEYCESPLLSYM